MRPWEESNSIFPFSFHGAVTYLYCALRKRFHAIRDREKNRSFTQRNLAHWNGRINSDTFELTLIIPSEYKLLTITPIFLVS